MLDALYASIVVVILNELGVRDVISIHDAFLVPESVHRELREDSWPSFLTNPEGAQFR